jgi:hypothetical protein
MLSAVDRYVIARHHNVVRVDFNREPDPPAPRFPGARGLRLQASDESCETLGRFCLPAAKAEIHRRALKRVAINSHPSRMMR